MNIITSKSIRKKIVAITGQDSSSFVTNYYRSPLPEELLYCENDKAVIFLCPEFNHYKLYFASISQDALEELFATIKIPEIYMEIISQKGLTGEEICFYLKYFEFKNLYLKMGKKLETNECNHQPQYSNPIPDIFNSLNLTFDKVYDHLPAMKELERLNEKGYIVSINEDIELKGFAVFNITGSGLATLNFIANYGTKQHLIELWRKFYGILNYFNISHLSLWCNAGNRKALNMYKIENFLQNGGYNYFFKLNN